MSSKSQSLESCVQQAFRPIYSNESQSLESCVQQAFRPISSNESQSLESCVQQAFRPISSNAEDSGYNIPDDLLADVLLRLPIESLLRSRCVSKSWRALIDSPEFTKMRCRTKSDHLKVVALRDQSTFCTLEFDSKDSSVASAKQLNYPLSDPESNIHLVGSCNGLLCLTNPNEAIVLWNPWKQKHWELPSPPIEYSIGKQVYFRLGLGYEPVNNDYKVVNFVRSSDIFEEASEYQNEVYVYSLRLNSWRRIGDFPWKFPDHETDVGAFANGARHWIVKKREWDVVNLIAFFDLGNEEFRQMPCPRDPTGVILQHLRILNGNLSLLSNYYSAGRYRVDISVMEEYGVEKSWTKLTSIKMPYGVWPLRNLTPIMFLKNGRELVLQIERDKLAVYDLWTGFMGDVSIVGSAASSCRALCVC